MYKIIIPINGYDDNNNYNSKFYPLSYEANDGYQPKDPYMFLLLSIKSILNSNLL